ncbi:MAG TPA: hypothetical protein VH352_22830, partial [Pseudonocardiaceae bacterium]|nr:hypothetical protein [Pseudonocardiaceae bacterium]
SSLNLSAGAVVPNLITVALGTNHTIDLYNFHGTINLVADLAGYYATGTGDPFFQLTPQRALDTRNTGGHSIGAGQTQTADLSEWLPTTAVAAVFNLTGTNTTAGTFVTAWPADSTQPLASNLNLAPGQTAANLATVALGSGARLNIANFHGTVDVIIDIAGYFAPAPTTCTGTCAITWGANFIGQLGNGTTGGQSAVPTQVPGITGLSAIASAYGDTYALNTDGTVYAWGINELQQLGNGRTDGELPIPAVVTGLPKITAISAGEQNGYALDVNQHAWAWGDNESGGLGDGNRTASAVPVQVSLPGPVTSVIGASTAAHALLADGTVWSWGYNQFGVLGNGTIGAGCGTASPVNCDSPTPVKASGLTNVVALYGGEFDTYAVKSDGTVWAWGWNAEGELANGTFGGDACYSVNTGPNCVALTPVQVTALTGVTKITGGYAVKADGTVLAWGDNSTGELGLGTTPTGNCNAPQPAQNCFYPTPVPLPGLSNMTDVTTGVHFAAALKSDGTVWVWGNNFYGQNTMPTESTVPVQIAGLSSVTKISAGLYHMAALTTGS